MELNVIAFLTQQEIRRGYILGRLVYTPNQLKVRHEHVIIQPKKKHNLILNYNFNAMNFQWRSFKESMTN